MPLPELERECTCPKTSCERHQNCAACYAFHQDKALNSHCLRPDSDATPELLARVQERLGLGGCSSSCGCGCGGRT